MRPIDANEAKAKLIDHASYNSSRGFMYLTDVLHKIDECQTLDVQSLVHAHWYFDPDKSIGCGITVSGMFCSNCGGDCPTGSHPYRDFKYCPHCGAKMDEEEGK